MCPKLLLQQPARAAAATGKLKVKVNANESRAAADAAASRICREEEGAVEEDEHFVFGQQFVFVYLYISNRTWPSQSRRDNDCKHSY